MGLTSFCDQHLETAGNNFRPSIHQLSSVKVGSRNIKGPAFRINSNGSYSPLNNIVTQYGELVCTYNLHCRHRSIPSVGPKDNKQHPKDPINLQLSQPLLR